MGLRGGLPLSPSDSRAIDTTWEQAGHRIAPILDGVAAVAVVGSDLATLRAVARGVAAAQSQRRRVYLGDLTTDEGADEGHGISEMILYGISLSRAATPSLANANLHVLSSGAESALEPDILGNPRWAVLSEQVHSTGALLVLAAPAGTEGLERLTTQLDGVLTVGDVAPPTGSRLLGEVLTAATMRTPVIPMRRVTPPPAASRLRPLLFGGIAAVAGALAWLFVPGLRGPAPATTAESVAPPPSLDLVLAPPPRVTSDAAWTAEIRFLNSEPDALTAVAALRDTFPAATFAPVATTTDSATWFRVLIGAFSDSISAENFLFSLRSRGSVPLTGGLVTHTPFALLLDSASDAGLAALRITGFHGRGLPAYALVDSTNVYRIYVGAFASGAEAGRMKQQLDSMNIQSALVIRAGSTR